MRDKERDHLPNTWPLLPHQPNHVWNHHFEVVKRYLAGFKMNSGIGQTSLIIMKKATWYRGILYLLALLPFLCVDD
jgi:hypothetical protein